MSECRINWCVLTLSDRTAAVRACRNEAIFKMETPVRLNFSRFIFELVEQFVFYSNV